MFDLIVNPQKLNDTLKNKFKLFNSTAKSENTSNVSSVANEKSSNNIEQDSIQDNPKS